MLDGSFSLDNTYSSSKAPLKYKYSKEQTIPKTIFDPLFIGSSSSSQALNTSELLQLGENSRFKDEIEYLLDGINPEHCLSIRRASYLEIVEKLTHLEFFLKFKAQGYIEFVFQTLLPKSKCFNEQDPILLFLFGLVLIILYTNQCQINFLVANVDFISLLLFYLKSSVSAQDLLKDLFTSSQPAYVDSALKNKTELKKIIKLKTLLLNNSFNIDPTQISYDWLAMIYLHQSVSIKTQNASVCQFIREKFLEENYLNLVFSYFQIQISSTDQEVLKTQFDKLGMFLKFLEYLTNNNSSMACKIFQEIFDVFYSLIGLLNILIPIDSPKTNLETKTNLALIDLYSILINISNYGPVCEWMIGSEPVILSVFRNLFKLSSSSQDLLLLNYGLLSNLFEKNPGSSSQVFIRSLKILHYCKDSVYCQNTKCILHGTDKKKTNAIRCLSRFFLYYFENKTNNVVEALISFYIAVTLGYVFCTDESNRYLILDELPNWTVIIDCIEKLIQLHQTCDSVKNENSLQFVELVRKLNKFIIV